MNNKKVKNDLDMLLDNMIKLDATDLHLVHNNPITFRIHKRITKTDKYIKGADIFKLLISSNVLSETQISNFHKTNSADFAYVYNGVRFRGNLAKEQGEHTCAIRRLSDKVISIENLGLPEFIKTEIQKNYGLILVTGPTGSGKTTTLNALIDYLNKRSRIHITTIEEPIEYVHIPDKAVITQQEVGKDTPSFAESMRSILRRDPDVILVGEMRDLETIETACIAAETGHLVFGTLHTNTAISSIDRIVSMFSSIEQQNIRSQLASNLRLIINQRLFPKIGGGMVPAYELLVVTPEMRHYIRRDDLQKVEELMRQSKNIGNRIMSDSINDLKERGLIDKNLIF